MKMFILNDKGTKILIFPYICFPERKEIRKKQLSMKIVADSAIPFLQGVLEPWAEVRYLPGSRIAAEDVRDADALLIRTRTRCDERQIGRAHV